MNETIQFFTLLATIVGMIVWLKSSLTAQFNERFNTIDERFNTIDERFNTMDERFNSFDKRLTRLEADHDKLGNKIDMLARDMTDIRAKDMTDIRERLARVEAKLDLPPNIDPSLPPVEA